jgi:DNA mismatch repair protein MutL
MSCKAKILKMRIVALPENTVRLLGSAAAITSPVDVIKELLDNALDAEATSVEVLVSPNIIDRIQVRDNGHGIHADGHNSLGCMGHTSKLTSFEELQTFEGKTLGFRGQALASANALGRISIVTRCTGDPTAVKLSLCTGIGGIKSQQRVSAPVGTTVTVTNLFESAPVRKQVAEKEAQKNLAKVKHLIHAYALARPVIRVSLKVSGGHVKHSWSYSPPPGAGIREAVVQVFGTGVMAECVLKVHTNKQDSPTKDKINDNGLQISIETVLPKPDADLSKLTKGSFCSVDSRPVSASRGTMKKLMSILKTHFKKSLGVDAEDRRLSDLFTCINVTCSPGSYDPNLEPSKGQVLFVDEPHLVRLFEVLCSNTYHNRQAPDTFVPIERRPLTRRTQTRTPPPSSDEHHELSEPSAPHLDEPPDAGGVRRPRTSEDSSLNVSLPAPSVVSAVPPHQVLRSSTGLQRHKAVEVMDSTGPTFPYDSLAEAVHQRFTNTEHAPAPDRNIALKEPRSSWRTHDLPTAEDRMQDQANICDGPDRKRKFSVNMSAHLDMSSDEETEAYDPGSCDVQDMVSCQEESCDDSKQALNPWTIARMTAPSRQTATEDIAADNLSKQLQAEGPHALPVPVEPFKELPILRPQIRAPRDLDTPRVRRVTSTHLERLQAPDDRFPTRPSSQYSQTYVRVTACGLPQSPSYIERPMERYQAREFTPYSNTLEDDIDRDGLVQNTLSFDEPREPRQDGKTKALLHIHDVPTRHNPPFRKLKRIKQRDQSRDQDSVYVDSERDVSSLESRNANKLPDTYMEEECFGPSNIPNLRPMGSGTGQLDHVPTAQQLDRGYAEINMLDEDPRKYLMSRRRSEAAHTQGRRCTTRTKNDKLPLETIPYGDGTEQLVLYLGHEIAKTCIETKRTPSLTAYCEGVCFGDLMSLEEVDNVQSRLQSVVTCWTEEKFGKDADIEIDLRKAVKRIITA